MLMEDPPMTEDRLAEIKTRMKAHADTPELRQRYFRIHGAMDLGFVVGEVERLRGLLGRLEWAGSGDFGNYCPACQGFEDEGHEPGCWLAKELGR